MLNLNKGVLRVGTSGIAVPGSKESFPAEFRDKSRLNYYASLFNTLEINSTFKKLPKTSTFEKWSQDVADDFQFTIKLWKEITHVKKLNIEIANIDLFFEAANHIGNKKGCLLVQFPGSITVEYLPKVEQVLATLYQLNNESEWRIAIELRSVTWYTDETLDLLNKYGVSIVLHDMPKSKNLEVKTASNFVYLRFHGPKGDYRGSYSYDFLAAHADRISNWLSQGNDVYAYFNNTMGSAYDNAMMLKAMVEKK